MTENNERSISANRRGFARVSRQSLPEAIADQLSSRLRAGEFRLDEQLPGHRQLAEAFGVSVPAVREALSRLTAQGWLEVRAGQGTYVRSLDPNAGVGTFSVHVSGVDGLLEILEARSVLETELAALAAVRADEQQLATLQRLVDRMWEVRGDAAAFGSADLAFHIALAEAAHNGVLLKAMIGLRNSMRDFLEVRSVGTTQSDARSQLAIGQHQAILDALKKGDDGLAREAVRLLMARVRDSLDGALPG